MKKTIIIFCYSLLILVSKISALEIVTDPQGYTHMINQIAKAEEQIAKTNELIRDTKQMKEDFSKVRTNLTLLYNNTFGIVGQLNGLYQEFTKLPEAMEALKNEFLSYTNCIVQDITEASKIETLRKAKYYRKTPKKHYFNYGTDPNANPNAPPIDPETKIEQDQKVVSDRFGSDKIQQFEDRPCNLVPTFEDDIKVVQEAFNAADTKVKTHIKKYYSEDGAQEFADKIKKIELEIAKENVTSAQIQSMSRNILVDIYLELQSMNDLMHLMSNHILANQQPSQPSKTLSKEQRDNINSLTNEEIYENQNTNNFLDEIINNYSNEEIDALPF